MPISGHPALGPHCNSSVHLVATQKKCMYVCFRAWNLNISATLTKLTQTRFRFYSKQSSLALMMMPPCIQQGMKKYPKKLLECSSTLPRCQIPHLIPQVNRNNILDRHELMISNSRRSFVTWHTLGTLYEFGSILKHIDGRNES